jgi:hypothetical protein
MSLEFQHQIRQNAIELQDYLKDLYVWEEKTTTEGVKKQPNYTASEDLPIRGMCLEGKSSLQTGIPLKRDVNTVNNYYSAWDKFDVV